MADHPDLEQIYTEAKSALKAREYDRARDLLASILAVDENYRDVSRLLAQTVRLRRRRWYNDIRLWGSVIGLVVIGLLVWIVPKISLKAALPSLAPDISSLVTAIPANTTIPTVSTSPTQTSIPLAWKRVSIGQEFSRDTITAIVVSPQDPDIIYIGMQSAGIFKSIDGGVSWTPTQQGIANAQILSLVINQQDSNTLLAATQGGVFVTHDGGKSWTQASDRIGNFLLIDPKNGSHLYLGDGSSVFESNDMGATWNQTSGERTCPSRSSYHTLVMDPNNSSTLFATTSGENEGMGGCQGVYRSTDNGRLWTRLGLEGADAFVITQGQDGNSVYLTDAQFEPAHGVRNKGGSTLSGLVVSTNQGKDWSMQQNYYCMILTTNPQNPTSAYCGIEQGGLSRISSPFGGVLSSGISAEHVTAIHVDTYNGQERIIAGVEKNGLYISKDGGKSWSHQIGGIGSSYLDLNESVDGTKLYVNIKYDSINCTLYRSDDGGRNWKTILSIANTIDENDRKNMGFNGFSICYPGMDADNNLYTIQDLAPMQFKNGGDIWGSISMPKLFEPLSLGNRWISANPHISGLLYFTSWEEPYLYYSIDQGQSWQKSAGASQHDNQDINAPLFFDDSGNIVYREWQLSLDAGKTWQDCNGKLARNDYSDSFLTVDPGNSKHIIIASMGGIWTSTDGCQSWTANNTGIGSLFVNSVDFDPKNPNIVYAGTDSGAYVSFDGGQSWSQINDGLLGATVVYSIMVDPQSNVYAATPYGIFKLESK